MNGPNNPIGWCDYTWNPVKGKCPVACPYCYARRIYDRFHYDPTIRLDEKELQAPFKLKGSSRIFVGSTIELFGNWILSEWLERILEVVTQLPQHTFIFLSKCPERFKFFDFPDNCWTGTTITREGPTKDYRMRHAWKSPARVHFYSFEPLHSSIKQGTFAFLSWMIIGAETGNRIGKITPKEEWIQELIDFANREEVPIFMKDNLKPYWNGVLRQEFPFRGLPIR